MSFTYTAALAFGGSRLSQTVTVTAESESMLSVSLVGAQTDYRVNFAVDVSQLKGFLWICDSAITICTNAASGGAPAQTLTIPADTPFSWVTGSGITNPLTTDITDLYVTKAASGTHTLQLYTAQDATP